MSEECSGDLIETSKQGCYFTLVLDENTLCLEQGLEDEGFKVIAFFKGLADEALKHRLRGWAIVTNNSKDFVDDAVRCDYDVIGIEGITLIEESGSTHQAVHKISNCIRRSQLSARKGNFFLKVRDDGTFHLQQLI